MAEPGSQNWKEKYLKALEEFDTSHRQDQQRLDILRRCLVRVSLAADGLDTLLDEQLASLRSDLRNHQDILSLTPLVTQLEQTVIALDERRKQELDTLRTLLEQDLDQCLALDLPHQDKSGLRSLRRQLADQVAHQSSHLALWQTVLQAQRQVRQALQQQIAHLRQGRGGLLGRLLGGNRQHATPPAEPPPTPAMAAPVADATLANLDLVERASSAPELIQRLSKALGELIGQLEVPVSCRGRKDKLLEQVRSDLRLELLPELLHEAAQLVAATRLLAQQELENFLVTLHHRLADIQQFLEHARAGEEQAQRNREKLDADVRQGLQAVSDTVESEGLHRLRDEIDGMVNRIIAAMSSFQEEEKRRRDTIFGQIEQLAHRMESMEAEATQLKNNLEAQRREALRDALTEMPNRAAYDEYMEREYSRWRRHGRPLSICIVDIDHFKQINDTLGHLRGDKVLKLVARELSRRLRSEDFAARYGGEEFVIIMPETDQQSALVAAEKIRQAIADCPFNFNNKPFPVTASFGVTAFTEGDTIESCFERADQALYRAKSQGRNRVEWG